MRLIDGISGSAEWQLLSLNCFMRGFNGQARAWNGFVPTVAD